MSQASAADFAFRTCCQTDEQARVLKVIYRKAGVANRYTVLPHAYTTNFVEEAGEGGLAVAVGHGPTTAERMQLYEEHSGPLALSAAAGALAQASTAPGEITHLVTVSCTGFYAPGIDVELIRGLGLSPAVERVHVGFMGCHGAINGMRTARGLAAADPAARVLLVAVELCSLHYRFQWDPEHFMGNSLFADGAAAFVAGNVEGQNLNGTCAASAAGPAAADSPALSIAATGSCVLADSSEAIGWKIGDHGFEMTLSARVPDIIKAGLRPWLDEWLARSGLTVAEVGAWAVHPGGPRILSAVEDSLQLGPVASVSREVLSEMGNMSSPTVLFIVDRLRRRNAPRPYVALAFGPGLTAEAALLV